METVVKKIDCDNIDEEVIKEAAALLGEGKLVAFPTETVYGLGGNAYDSTAASRIYSAKGRPSDNPLIVHISSFEELSPLVSFIPPECRLLSLNFWPGPLTMILNKSDLIPKETTGGLNTVAIRMPSHPIARLLIKEAGIPVAAPSANSSGRPSTTNAEHVIADLSGKIDMIIDGGSSDIGLESTIVDLTVKPALILRPGAITIEMLKKVLPDIEYDSAILKKIRDDTIIAKAPGMKYRHYAPKGELTVFEGSQTAVIQAIKDQASAMLSSGHTVGILASSETVNEYLTLSDNMPEANKMLYVMNAGSRDDESLVAKKLFDTLRYFDEAGADHIYAEAFPANGIGSAIMNRLIKAAGYRIINV